MINRLKNNPVIKYFAEARQELAKVTWPSAETTRNYSIFVVVMSLILAAYFGALDWALTIGLEKLLAAFGK